MFHNSNESLIQMTHPNNKMAKIVCIIEDVNADSDKNQAVFMFVLRRMGVGIAR